MFYLLAKKNKLKLSVSSNCLVNTPFLHLHDDSASQYSKEPIITFEDIYSNNSKVFNENPVAKINNNTCI